MSAPCNICGVEWPHHADACAYVHTARRADLFENALRAICTSSDSGPWIDVYRDAGGGYEGLQAIAEHALSRRVAADA